MLLVDMINTRSFLHMKKIPSWMFPYRVVFTESGSWRREPNPNYIETKNIEYEYRTKWRDQRENNLQICEQWKKKICE